MIYRNTHREELRASYKKYRAAYHLEEISARKRKDYAEHKDKYRARKLARAYNISMSDYDKIFVTQNGRCAICGCPFSGTPYVDHNHITREVRGLLCSHCNIMLGNAYDSPEILANAIKYLELYKGESRGISTGIQPINPRP